MRLNANRWCGNKSDTMQNIKQILICKCKIYFPNSLVNFQLQILNDRVYYLNLTIKTIILGLTKGCMSIFFFISPMLYLQWMIIREFAVAVHSIFMVVCRKSLPCLLSVVYVHTWSLFQTYRPVQFILCNITIICFQKYTSDNDTDRLQ